MSKMSKFAKANVDVMTPDQIMSLIKIYLDPYDVIFFSDAFKDESDTSPNSEKIEKVINSENHVIDAIYIAIDKHCGANARRRKQKIDDFAVLVRLLGVEKNFEYILGYMDHERIVARDNNITIALTTLVLLAIVALMVTVFYVSTH